MRNDHSLPGRRSVRLSEYDYTDQGPYFLTITANQRASLFGHIVDGEMCRNWLGQIVMEEWRRSAEIRPEFWFDAFVVMPNHIHAIVAIAPPILEPTLELTTDRTRRFERPAHSLGSFVAGFKSATTRRINQARSTPGAKVWQRNYYEHVIRSERSLERIREYVASNPQRWEMDRENPSYRRR